jgi:bifunctional UDP-N-acetylglucosamine pyrophosphorylase/glucosamine-1-phosphate N-acetyltransferase
MVLHVIDALVELDVERVVVVVGRQAELVTKTVLEYAPEGLRLEFAEQDVARGTGDAAAVALNELHGDSGNGDVVVLPGDTPLLRPETLSALVASHRARAAGVTLLTAQLEDPTGFGRVLRAKDDRVSGVVEHADASPEERAIQEVCTSIYCFERAPLAPALRRIGTKNHQGEHSLTDVVAVLYAAGYPTHSLCVTDPSELAGVNDRAQLALAETELRRRINGSWMRRGVTMWDPERTYVDASVVLGPDVALLPGTILKGATRIEQGAQIGPGAMLEDTVVGAGASLGTVVADHAVIGAGAIIDPFVVLAPGSIVAPGGHVSANRTIEASSG